MNVTTILEVLGIFLSGGIVGHRVGRNGRTLRSGGDRGSGQNYQNYKCGCSHHLSHHDPKTNKCNATVPTRKYDSLGDWVGWSYPACACKQYVGDRPPPTLDQLWPDAPKVGE